MTAVIFLLIGWVTLGPVLLRDGREIASEQIDGVDAQGIRLRVVVRDGVIPDMTFIPWADVRDMPDGWGEAGQYRAVADGVHRAETRLTRGDATGALRVLEPLAADYLPETGPTSGAIASGLAIGRALRGNTPGATIAWLAWRAQPAGPARAWIHAETSLMPALPPVWTGEDAARFLAGRSDPNGQPEVSTVLEDLYAAAAGAALGRRDTDLVIPEPRVRADPGVRLVLDIVRAQAEPDLEERRAAREALRRRLRPTDNSWQDAWVRLGIGVSMLDEPDPLEADAGAAELIGVMLRHQRSAPGLSALATDIVSEYFVRTSRPGHAEAVRVMNRVAARGLPTIDLARPQPDGADSPAENPEEIP